MKLPFKGFIPDDQASKHQPLSALTKQFRESVSWLGPETPPKSDEMELMMFRRPNEEPDPGKDHFLVAVDRRNFKGQSEDNSLEILSGFWETMLDHIRAMPADWFKAGAVIWDHLGFEISSEWTAGMLGLEHADADMTRASQAALFSAVLTCPAGADLETVLFALATFIHAHPRLADSTVKDPWHLPYGESTVYRVRRSGSKPVRRKGKLRHRP